MSFNDLTPKEITQFLKDRFGPTWVDLESETITDDLNSIEPLSVSAENKLRAVRAIFLSDEAYTQWHVFSSVIKALNGLTPDFTISTPPSLVHLAAGLYEMHNLRDLSFSAEIRNYLAVLLLTNGIFKAPSFIPVQKELDSLIGNGYIPASTEVNDEKNQLMEAILKTYS